MESATRVVLERLDLPEVVAVAFIETVLAVELDAATVHDVVVRKGLRVGCGLRSVEVRGATCRQRAVQATRILEEPHQLLDGVIERQIQTGLGRCHRLRQGVLELLNQVLVRVLGKAAALVRVQVDVVNVDGRILRGREGGRRSRDSSPAARLNQVGGLAKPDIEVDVVVLERNERQGQTGIAVEPESEGDVENRRATVAGRQRARGTDRTRKELVSLHALIIAGRQALPEVPPLTVVTVNDLSTDLHLNLLQHEVSQAAHAAGCPLDVVRRTRRRCCRVRQRHLEVRAVDQVSVAVHDGDHTLSVLGRAREVDTHCLHREVGVPLVHDLPEGDVRIASDVSVLCTVGNELKKTTAHCVYLLRGYILLRLNNEGAAGRHVLSVREEGQEDLEGGGTGYRHLH